MAIRIRIVKVIAIIVLHIVRIAIGILVICRIVITIDGVLVGLICLIGGLRL